MTASCICRQNIQGHPVFQILCKEYFCFLCAWGVERNNSLLYKTQKCYRASRYRYNEILASFSPRFFFPWMPLLSKLDSLRNLSPTASAGIAVSQRKVRQISDPIQQILIQLHKVIYITQVSVCSITLSISHRSLCATSHLSHKASTNTAEKIQPGGTWVTVNTELFSLSNHLYVYVGTLWHSNKCVQFSPRLLPALSLCLSRLLYKWPFSVGCKEVTGLGSVFYQQLYHRIEGKWDLFPSICFDNRNSRMWKPDSWNPGPLDFLFVNLSNTSVLRSSGLKTSVADTLLSSAGQLGVPSPKPWTTY